MDYRTDLAMERTVRPGGMGEGVSVHTQQQAGAEVTWVRVSSEKAAERLGKAQGLYWTLTHPKLPHMLPEERMDIAREVAQMLRMMLPPQGDVLVLGLMLSNGLVALSGALMCQYSGGNEIKVGQGAIVIGLAAVIIGEVLLDKVFHNFALKLLAVSIGAILYYIVIQAVLQLGLNPNFLKLLSAAVVAVFLSIPYWKGKYFHGQVKVQAAGTNMGAEAKIGGDKNA